MTDAPNESTPDITNVLTEFGFSSEDFSFLAEHPEEFVPSGRTARFTVGERISFLGSVNGKDIEAIGHITKMRLNRVSLIEQASPNTGQTYKLITGTMNPVVGSWSVIIKDSAGVDREVPLQEFMRQMVNVSRPATNQFDPTRFNDVLNNVGMRFGGNMVLLWQHMGVHDEKGAAFMELCESEGAQETIQQIPEPGRLQSVLVFGPNKGLDVTYFELGLRVDRSISRTGQGFQDPIDAMVTNLRRSIAMRSTVAKLKADLESKTDLDEDQRDALATQINNMSRAARSYMNNISGAQEQIRVDDDGKLIPTGQWFPVSAPIGRMTVLRGNGQEQDIDLWKTPTDMTVPTVDIDSSLLIDTTAQTLEDQEGDEEPF